MGAPVFRIKSRPGTEPAASVEMGESDANESVVQLKIVDANGLALMCFGFSTWMFFAFLCNVDGVGGTGANNGVFHLCDMLIWGVSMGLCVSGIIQGLNGDHLGFTSYLFHAAILGTIGHNFKMAVVEGVAGAGKSFAMIGFFCYAAFFFNCVFTIMAFRIAKMFGVLYASVALMFLLVGLNFAAHLTDSGNMLAGLSCLLVSLQCFYLLI